MTGGLETKTPPGRPLHFRVVQEVKDSRPHPRGRLPCTRFVSVPEGARTVTSTRLLDRGVVSGEENRNVRSGKLSTAIPTADPHGAGVFCPAGSDNCGFPQYELVPLFVGPGEEEKENIQPRALLGRGLMSDTRSGFCSSPRPNKDR